MSEIQNATNNQAPMQQELNVPITAFEQLRNDVVEWMETHFGANPSYDVSMQARIDEWGLPWFRAGAIVRNRAGKILMIHEGKIQIKKIKDEQEKARQLASHENNEDEWVDGDGGWNLPSGRLKPGESFEDGAHRELEEESGWQGILVEPLHVRKGDKPKNLYILPVYLFEAMSGPEQYRTKDHEVIGIGWFTVQEIKQMQADELLRSPDFVMESLEAYEEHIYNL